MHVEVAHEALFQAFTGNGPFRGKPLSDDNICQFAKDLIIALGVNSPERPTKRPRLLDDDKSSHVPIDMDRSKEMELGLELLNYLLEEKKLGLIGSYWSMSKLFLRR